MSQQQSPKSKRTLAIGATIAVAVAVALVGEFFFHVPSSVSAVGTMAPAGNSSSSASH